MRDFFWGIGSGVKYGAWMAGSQFSPEAWEAAKASAAEHREKRRYGAFVGAAISGFVTGLVVGLGRQVVDFFRGIGSGIKFGVLIPGSQFSSQRWEEAKKSAADDKAHKRYGAFVGAAIAGAVTGLFTVVARQMRDFFWGIASGAKHATLVIGNVFSKKSREAASASAAEHKKKRRYGAFVGGVLSGIVVGAVVGAFSAVLDFSYGICSGVKHTFRMCWRLFDENGRKGFSDAWQYHGKRKGYIAQAGMVLATAVAFVPAFLIGVVRNIKKTAPMILAGAAWVAKHVLWKGIKAATFSLGKVLGGFFGNLKGGALYAGAKVVHHIAKTIPVIRKVVPTFRHWGIALAPLKKQLDAQPSVVSSDERKPLFSDKAERGSFLDEVNYALLDALRTIQRGDKVVTPLGFLDEGAGFSYRMVRQLPGFVSKDTEYWLKVLHEHLLDGKVIFKGNALPACMQSFNDRANPDTLPSYKFRFFKSGNPELSRELTLDGQHYRFKFFMDTTADKLIVEVSSPVAFVAKPKPLALADEGIAGKKEDEKSAALDLTGGGLSLAKA